MPYLDDLFSLNNKVALVTGAARGNGKTISEALLRSGATVILVDILKKELTLTVKSFLNQNLDAFEFNCDITNTNQILKLCNFVKKKFGKLDILINNAGVSFPHTTIDYPDKLWEKTYQVNLKAPFNLSKEFAVPAERVGDSAMFTGKRDPDDFTRLLKIYVSDYIRCITCQSPDTRIEKEKRIHFLICEACGAKSTIKGKYA